MCNCSLQSYPLITWTNLIYSTNTVYGNAHNFHSYFCKNRFQIHMVTCWNFAESPAQVYDREISLNDGCRHQKQLAKIRECTNFLRYVSHSGNIKGIKAAVIIKKKKSIILFQYCNSKRLNSWLTVILGKCICCPTLDRSL